MKQTTEDGQDEIYKGTALDEDADIYSRREEKTAKQTWKELDKKGRWQFFKDYIMWKVIVALVVVLFVVIMINGSKGSNKNTVLYVAFVDEQLNEDAKNDMTADIEELIGVSKNEKVMLDDYFYTSSDGLSRIQVYTSSGEIDVIIADRTEFKILAGGGYFEDISQFMGDDMDDDLKSRLCYAKGYLEGDFVGAEENRNGKGPEAAYGISLEGLENYDKVKNLCDDPVVGVVTSGEHKENARKFIEYLLETGN